MRKDEEGNDCPETLGEYLKTVQGVWAKAGMGDRDNRAARFLQRKIAAQGEHQKVAAPDSQMKMILMGMMFPRQFPEYAPAEEDPDVG